jgi:hypothetical protein
MPEIRVRRETYVGFDLPENERFRLRPKWRRDNFDFDLTRVSFSYDSDNPKQPGDVKVRGFKIKKDGTAGQALYTSSYYPANESPELAALVERAFKESLR